MKILLIYDVDNWAWHHRAKAIQKYCSSDEFEIDICNNSTKKIDFSQYDHIHDFDIDISNKHSVNTSSGIYCYGHMTEEYIPKMRPHQAIICVNQDQYKWLKLHNVNKNIYYIRNGIDLNLFYPKPELKKPYKFVVGFSAKKTPPHYDLKGYHCIWRVLMERLEKYEHIEFYEHSLHYYDGVKHDEMINVFNKMNLLVCPSQSEGSIGSLIEAMACGIPILATATGVVPELRSEGVIKADKYDLNDHDKITEIVDFMERKILELSYNVDKCAELGELNRLEILEDFSWEKISKKWEDFFRDMSLIKPIKPIKKEIVIPDISIDIIPKKRDRSHQSN
jgi:glycosyltransferase involved in cell wall biosynthesis